MADWNTTEEEIKKIADLLKSNLSLSPFRQNDPVSCHDCIFRNIAILVISGKTKLNKFIDDKDLMWGNNQPSLDDKIAKKHGGDWHSSYMQKITNYFKKYNINVIQEPNLYFGKADIYVPDFKLKVKTRRSIRPLDISKLIDEIKKDNKSKSKERDQLIFTILYYTGIRVQELISLKPANIKNEYLLLNNNKIRLNFGLILKIKNYINKNKLVDNEYLFTNISPAQNHFVGNKKHLTVKTIQELINKYTKNFNHNYSLRDLRCSYILNSKNNIIKINKINTYNTTIFKTDYITYLKSPC